MPSDTLQPADVVGTLPGINHAVEEGLGHRLQHLGLVLWVGLSMPLVGCTYYLLGGVAPTLPGQRALRLWTALIAEVTSLMVLWYVMTKQGRAWKDVGWEPRFSDFRRALGLLVVAIMTSWGILIPLQYLYRAHSGQFLAPKSLNSMFGFGISTLSFALICLNPFFEELIVRAYTMTEIMNLGGSRGLAIMVSVVAQMSYHLYQGLVNALALTVMFTVFSIYYARTRRIVPIILVHLCLDLFALFRGAF